MIITKSTKCGCQFEIGGWITASCKHGRLFTLDDFDELIEITKRPKIICLCGSTRFYETFQQANLEETMKGNIVLTIGCDTKSDNDLFNKMTPDELAETKNQLDILHYRKIDMADEILILNVGGYIGESTARELAYAKKTEKFIRFYQPHFPEREIE